MATFEQYKTSKGDFWRFQVYLGVDYVTGKEIRTTRGKFLTKKAAQKALNELLVNFEKKKNLKGNISLFKEVYELWFTSYKRDVKETTYLKTERLFKNYILPVMGNLKIDRINVSFCQKVANNWYDSFSYASSIVSYSSRVFDYAITSEVLDTNNPMKHILKPKKRKQPDRKNGIKYYNKEQLEIFLKHIDTKISSDQSFQSFFWESNRALFRLLALSGIRVSEALALNWSDLNLETNTININKSLSKTKKGYIVSTTKTERSNREVLLDSKTIHTLKRWKLKQRELLLAIGKQSIDFMFCNFSGGRLARQNIYKRSKSIADSAKIPSIGCHGFRHTHATLLFESGASLKHIQHRLGHTNIQITANIYTHITDNDDKIIVDGLARHINF